MTDATRAAALVRLRPHVERARAFSGWTLDVRVTPLGLEPPWDYGSLVRAAALGARCALDLGTGGGEALAEFRDALPPFTVATEEWHVNAPIAYARLTPLGVRVLRARGLQLAFADASFDLVINRHEELDPAEVARVLRPGGRVVTQQVGGDEWDELWHFIPPMQSYHHIYADYQRGFTEAGLRVIAREHRRHVAYPLEEIAFMLAIMPWSVPDFDLERALDALLALEAAHGSPEGVILTEHRFVIEARRA